MIETIGFGRCCDRFAQCEYVGGFHHLEGDIGATVGWYAEPDRWDYYNDDDVN